MILVGTKGDLSPYREIKYEEFAQWAKEKGIPYIEIPTKNFDNVIMTFHTLLDEIYKTSKEDYITYCDTFNCL